MSRPRKNPQPGRVSKLLVDEAISKNPKLWEKKAPRREPVTPTLIVRVPAHEAINAAAKAVIRRGEGWSEHKAFVSDVYREVRLANKGSIQEFKKLLLNLRREGSVKLSRADLVEAMPADKVKASQIDERLGFGTIQEYHFVRID